MLNCEIHDEFKNSNDGIYSSVMSMLLLKTRSRLLPVLSSCQQDLKSSRKSASGSDG